MKKFLSILVVLVVCLSMAVTAFANDDFVSSPGESGTPCDHEKTEVTGEKNPTCTNNGYTGDTVCSGCGEVIEEGEVIEKLGHEFKDGKCVVCGASDVPKTGDNSAIFMWTVLMAVSAVAVVFVSTKARKRA